ncbi:hypothetical protein GcC1_211029 [Golovinomyces cichoracearum]|uniref:Uncharacterized protein n=1 Tax=Golovinomyces cichoracearum TaxID=62708 RepID=A0A420HAG9_9PEZI|nr:hypothetical protein GcC1_211029 [Golovinomyces cichoracearum]
MDESADSETLQAQIATLQQAQSLAPITGTPSRITSKPPAKRNATTTKATATKNTKNAMKTQAVKGPVKDTAKPASTRPHELWNEVETIFMIDFLQGAVDEGEVSDGGFEQKKTPELYVWKHKPFPYYEAMKSLMGENGGATGLYAVNCGQAEHSEEDEERDE